MMMPQITRYQVPVSELKKHVDPLSGGLWGCGPITEAEIWKAVDAGQFETQPWDSIKDRLQGPAGRDFHIGRVAYFVENGLPSDEHSIRLNLDTQPNGDEIGIDNGNHRVAAAIIRDDEHVEAMLFFFDQADISRLLPGAVQI